MNAQMVTELNGLIPLLKGGDANFARSLVKQFEKKGDLSPKQWPYVDQLIRRAMLPDAAKTPAKPKATVGDFSKVVALLQVAKKSGLKWPKIQLQLADGTPLVLKLAGPNSKYAGSVQMTDGKPFGVNAWFGAVSPEGKWTAPKNLSDARRDEIGALLRKLAKDPAGVAKAHGGLTGSCCFCNLPLTDEKSVYAGYGPVCAGNWGLPWGKKSGT